MTGDEVTITGDPEDATGGVEIPAEIGGLPVTEIAWDAFHGCTGLTSVTLPDNLISIGSYAFANCTSLPAAIFLGDAPSKFDLDAFSIEIDESTLKGFESASGNFNGYVIEDANDTLPDFVSVKIDGSVSTRIPKQILVSPNTIWVNDESYIYGADEFVRLIVTFAEAPSTPAISITPATNGSMLLEAPAEPGKTYQFEQSTDLVSFTPIDLQFVAASPFVTTHLKPTSSQMYYRRRLVE